MGSNKGPIAASGRLDVFLGIFAAIGVIGVALGLVLWIGIGGNSTDQNLAADPLVETSVSDNESITDLPTTTTNEIAVQTSTTKPTPSSSVTTTIAPMYPTECTDPIDAPLSDGLPLRSSIQTREFAYVAPEERQRVVVYARPNSDIQFVCAHVRHTSNSIQEEWQTEVLLEPNGTPWMATEGYVYWSFTFVPPADAPLGEYEVFLTAVDSSGLVNSGQITSFDLVDPNENESSPSEAASPSSTCGPPQTWFEPTNSGHGNVSYEEADGVANLRFTFQWSTAMFWTGGWWNTADKTCDSKGFLWAPWDSNPRVPIDPGVPDFFFVESWAEIGGSPCGSRTNHESQAENGFTRGAVGEAACLVSTGLSPGQLDVSVFLRTSNGQTFSNSLQIDI